MFLSSLKQRSTFIVLKLILSAVHQALANFKKILPLFTFAAVGAYALRLLNLQILLGELAPWALSFLGFLFLWPLYRQMSHKSEWHWRSYLAWMLFMTIANAIENSCVHIVINFQKTALLTHRLEHPKILVGILLGFIPLMVLQTLLFLALPETINGNKRPYQAAWGILRGRIFLLSSLFIGAQLIEKLPSFLLQILKAFMIPFSASLAILIASLEPLFIVFSWYFAFLLAQTAYAFVGKGDYTHSFLAKDA